jgi:quercetin dioxygenase-like cupin family protein
MNIAQNLPFSATKPAVLPIHKTDKLNLFAVGLLQDQVLQKHKAGIPTLLTVLKGTLAFAINGEVLRLEAFDTYHIPVGVEHEVTGMEAENIFTLTQEK